MTNALHKQIECKLNIILILAGPLFIICIILLYFEPSRADTCVFSIEVSLLFIVTLFSLKALKHVLWLT